MAARWIWILPVFTNLLAFGLFGMDKSRAKRKQWRISENALLLAAFFGGIGAWLGMQVFHHKTRKAKFALLVPVFALLQAGILLYFLYVTFSI